MARASPILLQVLVLYLAKTWAQNATIGFSTFLGGNGQDYAHSVATFGGQFFVVGSTASTDLSSSPHAMPDAFLATYSSIGSRVNVSYIGGNGEDSAEAVFVAPSGAVWVVGETSSTDFPLQVPYDSTLNGTSDGFISSFSADGTLLWSTYFGGSGEDVVTGVAVSSGGDLVYVVGTTTSADFPVTTGSAFQGTSAGFFAVFSAGELLSSTYLVGNASSGSATTQVHAIALDENTGSVFIVGTSNAASNWVSTMYRIGVSGQQDAFVALASSTTYAVSSTLFVGGSNSDSFTSVATNGVNVFLGGISASSNFPLTNALKATNVDGSSDGVFVVLSSLLPQTATLSLSTYIGGSSTDQVNAVALATSFVYLTGSTQSVDFPYTSNARSKSLSGLSDAFIVAFNSTAPFSYSYSTYWGGSGSESGNALVGTASGITLAGMTSSTDFYVTSAAQATKAAVEDAFVTGNVITQSPSVSQLEPTNDNVVPYSTGGVQGKKSSRGGKIAGIVLGLFFGSLFLLAVVLGILFWWKKMDD